MMTDEISIRMWDEQHTIVSILFFRIRIIENLIIGI